MALPITDFMANRQVFHMAVATFAQRLNMLQRGCLGRDVLTANPTRHDAMQLPRHGFIHFVPRKTQAAHKKFFKKFTARKLGLVLDLRVGKFKIFVSNE